jgi:rubredoxin
MGNIVATLCRSCGFKNEFRLGGGRFSYKTNCPIPAINKETLEFENVNHYEHKDSGKYLFYSDDDLKGDNYNDKRFSNFDLSFNEEGNYCPSCKAKKLAFRITMYID